VIVPDYFIEKSYSSGEVSGRGGGGHYPEFMAFTLINYNVCDDNNYVTITLYKYKTIDGVSVMLHPANGDVINAKLVSTINTGDFDTLIYKADISKTDHFFVTVFEDVDSGKFLSHLVNTNNQCFVSEAPFPLIIED
jgi:hypothetical protein